jgi:hypothetical protein
VAGIVGVNDGAEAGGWSAGELLCGTAPKLWRYEMPVPGSDAVPTKPRGPKFNVTGAPPMLALNPLRERLSRTPGITLNDFLKRQDISVQRLALLNHRTPKSALTFQIVHSH